MIEYGSGGSMTVTMNGPFSGGGGSTTNKLITIFAPVSNWKGGTSPFSQVVEVEGININSKVDIQMSAEQIVQLSDQIIAFTAENKSGVVTLYAIGDKPAADCELQATLSEVVNVTADDIQIIRGNTVTTNMPRADYSQNDETKADFIKNKPTEAISEALNKARNALPRTGGDLSGTLNMTGNVVENIADPTKAHHAVNKKYLEEYVKNYAIDVETSSAVTLSKSGWKNKKITADVEKVTSDTAKCHVMVSPDPEEENYLAYCEANVRAITQGEGAITFTCTDVPEKDLIVHVMVRRIPG